MTEHQDPAVPSSAETPSAQEDTVIPTQLIDTPTEKTRESSPKTPPLVQPTTGVTEEALQDQDDHLQIDDAASVGDSAYGSSVASSSVSLASSITNYQYENGRRYHAYKEGEYFLPNDEIEQARLDLQHHIYRLCLGGALYCAPIKDPQSILDIGTGTGIWGIEMADEFPAALVIGTDLSPIQPGFVPPNIKFYVDDFEADFTFPEVGKFDYIHWRSLCGSTADWPKLYRQCFSNLKTGGWLEVQEYDAWVYSDDDEKMEKAPWTKDWCETIDRLSTQFGKTVNVARSQKQWMEAAGFVDVHERVVKVPLGPWTRDPVLKEIGRYERWHMNESVEAHSMALYTRVLNYSMDQAKVVFEMIKNEFNDQSLHLYTVYRFVYGRRPEA